MKLTIQKNRVVSYAVTALALTFGLGTVASAATFSEEFIFNGNDYAGPGTSMNFTTAGGIDIAVTAFNYTNNPLTLSSSPIGVDLQKGTNGGLGACTSGTATNCGANPLLNGVPLFEALIFSFSQGGSAIDVSMDFIFFSNSNQSNVNNAETFDLFSGPPLTQVLNDYTVFHSGNPAGTDLTSLSLSAASIFGIGIDNAAPDGTNTDQVRVRKFTITYDRCDPAVENCGGGGSGETPPVPVPASLPLLLSALGAGYLIRRRARKTA